MGLFATHPPIEERIQAIDPGFQPGKETAPARTPPPAAGPTPKNVALAGAMLAAMPVFAREGARSTASAVPLIYALLLSDDAATREKQLSDIQLSKEERAEVDRDIQRSGEISDALGLMDLCLPALRQLSDAQYANFRSNVQALIQCDGEVDLFEFVLHKALVRHVDHYFTKSRGAAVRYRSLVPLLPDIATTLSALAWHAGDSAELRDAAFQAGVAALLLKPGAFPMQRVDGCDFAALDAALDRITESDPATKRKIFNACNQAVRHDGVVQPREAALLRAVSDVLACPMLDPENVA